MTRQARRAAYNRKPALRGPAERDALAVANLGLARAAAVLFRAALHPAARRSYSFDDALADSYLGLLRAAELFDPAKGEFSTIAFWHMRQVMRRAARRDRLVPMPEYRFLEGAVPPPVRTGYGAMTGSRVGDRERGAADALADTPEPDRGDAEHREREAACEEFRAAVALLPEPYRVVLEMRAAGKTLAEVGDALGITREAVRQRQGKAVGALRVRGNGG